MYKDFVCCVCGNSKKAPRSPRWLFDPFDPGAWLHRSKRPRGESWQPALKLCPASPPPSSAHAGYLRALDDAQRRTNKGKRVTDWVQKQKTLKDNLNVRGSHRVQDECHEAGVSRGAGGLELIPYLFSHGNLVNNTNTKCGNVYKTFTEKATRIKLNLE